jgi:hypothetical protein
MAFNTLTPAQGKIINLLIDYRYLTIEMLSRLVGLHTRTVQKRVKELLQNNLIQMIPRYQSDAKGRPEQVIGITQSGFRIVNEWQKWDSKTSEYFNLNGNIEHHLLTNQFRIWLSMTAEADTEISMKYFDSNPTRNFTVEISFQVGTRRIEINPDAIFTLTHERKKKTLLYFLETDTGSESLRGLGVGKNSIEQKIQNYQLLFATKRYKEYEATLEHKLKGFRVLILCESEKRAGNIDQLQKSVGSINPFQVQSFASLAKTNLLHIIF